MKRVFLLPLLAVALTSTAQDTYINERISNNSGDVIGTARYVGMGGALGALGADLSVISWNPAGIGLYRKNDIALTFGGTWGKSAIEEERRGTATFDQIGFVFSLPTGAKSVPYLNLAFNYQKKINFNNNFYANNDNLNGLSQMFQVAELTDWSDYDDWMDGYQPNLANLAWDNGYFDNGNTDNGERYRKWSYPSSSNVYTHHSSGSLHAFDINLSTNIKDRYFVGLTAGIDKMNYSAWSLYGENDFTTDEPQYDLSNDVRITGYGFNVKLGTIIRPIEDSPFRFGLAVETPTWYKLKNSTYFCLYDYLTDEKTRDIESYLKYNLRSPWKFRTSIGSTLGTSFAWGIDYEAALYGHASMGYPEDEDDFGDSWGNVKDKSMYQLTRDNLRTTHTLRAGMEVKATQALAFRLGYNYISSAYEKRIAFDQYNLDSYSMNYATSTNYMRAGDTNILTLGMGYRYKRFYIDMAYKIRHQTADFYAFDSSFTQSSQFVKDYPELAGKTLSPTEVDLTRHTISCTLGFKF